MLFGNLPALPELRTWETEPFLALAWMAGIDYEAGPVDTSTIRGMDVIGDMGTPRHTPAQPIDQPSTTDPIDVIWGTEPDAILDYGYSDSALPAQLTC